MTTNNDNVAWAKVPVKGNPLHALLHVLGNTNEMTCDHNDGYDSPTRASWMTWTSSIGELKVVSASPTRSSMRRCESKWRFRLDKQPQPTQQRTTKRRVVVCLCGTRVEIAYGEGDASTPKEWCRCRQRALLMTRSDRRRRGMKTGAFLKPRKS